MDTVKTCPVCGSEFSFSKLHPYQVFCSRTCSRKQWRNLNPEKLVIYSITSHKQWRNENKEHITARQKKYRELNYEKLKALRIKNNHKRVNRMNNSYLAQLMRVPLDSVNNDLLNVKRMHIEIIRKIKELKRNENT